MFTPASSISSSSLRMVSQIRLKTSTGSTNSTEEPPRMSKKKLEILKMYSDAEKRSKPNSKTSSKVRSRWLERSKKISRRWNKHNSRCSKISKDKKKTFSKPGKIRSSKRAKSMNSQAKSESRKTSYFCLSNRIQSSAVRSKKSRKSWENASRKSGESTKNWITKIVICKTVRAPNRILITT